MNLYNKRSMSTRIKKYRRDRIRTCGLVVPNDALYQTEPHAERKSTDLYLCKSWATRIRTLKCWSQSPVPYHLAIAQSQPQAILYMNPFRNASIIFKFFKKIFIYPIYGFFHHINALLYSSLPCRSEPDNS